MTPATEDPRLIEDGRLAEEIYERVIRANLRPEDDGKFVAVALQSEDYELDHSDYAVLTRLRARRPNERLWLMKTGPESAYRIRGLLASQP